MKRLTTTYNDEVYDKLKERTSKKGITSMSDCIREMVDMVLELEGNQDNILEKNDDANLKNIVLEMQQILKNNLTWMLETRLLVRHIVEYLPGKERAEQIKILEKYKEVSANKVNQMLNENAL